MSIRSLDFVFLAFLVTPILAGGEITGTIVIKRQLTKHNVTPSVPMYRRGRSVELGKDSQGDPLAFERSRVVIYLEGPGPSNPVRTAMQQVTRRFSPDLLVVPAGSTVSFPNMDPIFHNVFSLSKTKAFDLGNYKQGESRTIAFTRPGIVYVDCHLHPNMAATVVVTPNQWYARADGAGRFTLHDVSPGEYTVVAWHKAAGFFRKQVSITATRDANIEFFLPIGADDEIEGSRQ